VTEKRPALLVVNVEVDEEDVEELHQWYEEEHRPEKMGLPGYTSLRRFRANDGKPHFLAIYELDYPEAAEIGPNMPRVTPSEWSKAVQAKWKDWNRRVWVELTEYDTVERRHPEA
jgi:hypothetical protein